MNNKILISVVFLFFQVVELFPKDNSQAENPQAEIVDSWGQKDSNRTFEPILSVENNDEKSFSGFAEKIMKFFLEKGYSLSKTISDRLNSDSTCFTAKTYDEFIQDDEGIEFTSQDYKQLFEKYNLFVDQTAKKFKDFKVAVLKTIGKVDLDKVDLDKVDLDKVDLDKHAKQEIQANKKEIEELHKKISNLQMKIVVGLVGFIAYEAFRYYQNSNNSDK
jgi:hypothetical protein